MENRINDAIGDTARFEGASSLENLGEMVGQTIMDIIELDVGIDDTMTARAVIDNRIMQQAAANSDIGCNGLSAIEASLSAAA